ncbi:LysR family transcriptional regulator [bacterium]|nr:LysR family transcriptional regulator [bacterium]
MPRDPFAVRLRLYAGPEIAIGPGKADLLELIEETGSIAESAREMDMSYKRAWSLVKAMNESFAEPLVEREVGGRKGGGAQLTDLGREIVTAYRAAERAAHAAAAPHIELIKSRLAPSEPDPH